MTREEIINGLKFTIEMFLLEPSTGETITEPRNDMDKTTIDACRGAIELLEQKSDLDKVQAEIEKVYMNITYQENKDRKATWGLRKALEIIDKCKAESGVQEC